MRNERGQRELRRNSTDDPELRHTEAEIARAVPGGRRVPAGVGAVVLHRDRLQQRAWTAEEGSARSVVEVVAEELGPVGDGDHFQGDEEP
jgi:hypothetical protein